MTPSGLDDLVVEDVEARNGGCRLRGEHAAEIAHLADHHRQCATDDVRPALRPEQDRRAAVVVRDRDPVIDRGRVGVLRARPEPPHILLGQLGRLAGRSARTPLLGVVARLVSRTFRARLHSSSISRW